MPAVSAAQILCRQLVQCRNIIFYRGETLKNTGETQETHEENQRNARVSNKKQKLVGHRELAVQPTQQMLPLTITIVY
jgi:hypothetical protein